jgi:hypothetical protein
MQSLADLLIFKLPKAKKSFGAFFPKPIHLPSKARAKAPSVFPAFSLFLSLQYFPESIASKQLPQQTNYPCGHIHKGLELSDRWWRCPSCQSVNDRDENAAINIKAVGSSNRDRLGDVRQAPLAVAV